MESSLALLIIIIFWIIRGYTISRNDWIGSKYLLWIENTNFKIYFFITSFKMISYSHLSAKKDKNNTKIYRGQNI